MDFKAKLGSIVDSKTRLDYVQNRFSHLLERLDFEKQTLSMNDRKGPAAASNIKARRRGAGREKESPVEARSAGSE